MTARSLWLQRVTYLLCHDWQLAGDLVQTTVTQLAVRDVQIATVGSSVGRNTTLAFSPGLAVTLAAPDWRRAPNTTVAGRPAFQRSQPARDRRPTAPLT